MRTVFASLFMVSWILVAAPHAPLAQTGVIPGPNEPIIVTPPGGSEDDPKDTKKPRRGRLSARCAEDGQCRSGRCFFGVGRAKKARNGTCAKPDGEARAGQYCTRTAQCARGKCTDHRCTVIDLGGECSGNRECGSRVCSSSTCVAAPGEAQIGEFCTTSPQCESMYCYEGLCVAASGVAAGEPCTRHDQCESGACTLLMAEPKCEPADGTSGSGEYCLSDSNCEGNMVCGSRDDDFACAAPWAENGEPCWGPPITLSPIIPIHLSTPRLVCISGRCDHEDGTCIPNDGEGALGTWCTHNHHCESGTCIENFCRSPLTNQAVGEACSGNGDCSSGRCDGADLRCIPPNDTARAGDYCTHDNHCSGALVCTGRACTAPNVPLGEYCADHDKDPCETGHCDSAMLNYDKVCVPDTGHGKIGDYCNRDAQCSTLYCVDDECKALGDHASGLGCVLNSDCQSGRCDTVPGPGQSPRCIPNDGSGTVGEFCNHKNQCQGGLRCIPTTPGDPDWSCQH